MRRAPARAAASALCALLAACGGRGNGDESRPAAAAQGGSRFHFVDVAREAGLERPLFAGRPDKDHLLDSAGAGVAWLDFDRDGRLDAYLVNGWKLEGSRVVERGRNALYRNRGDGTFEDVTQAAGVGGDGRWGSGVAVADYDGDGWTDLFVTSFGPSALYRNRGDGTFEDVAARAGLADAGWYTGAAFLDADGDGHLDLYVAAYIDQRIEDVLAARPTLDWKGVDEVAVGPFGLPGAADRFYRARGDGTFVDATAEAGLTDRALAFGFGVRTADFDRDGDVDIYVANDSDANYHYRNEGDGTFTEVGLWSGDALDATGAAQAGMGATVGDADGDGSLDILVTNFAEDFSTLYLNDGRGFFHDAAEESGVGPATWISLSWGTAFADFDSDGDLDVVIANGHIYPQVDRHPELGLNYEQPTQLLENRGAARFVEVTADAGPGLVRRASSRGLAAGDYDNDGDLDLLIARLDAPPALLRNDSPQGSWLAVELVVPPGSGSDIGALVTVEAGGARRVRDRSSADSFLSAHDPRLHFGLGAASRVDRLEVRWPDGSIDELRDLPVNRRVAVRKSARGRAG